MAAPKRKSQAGGKETSSKLTRSGSGGNNRARTTSVSTNERRVQSHQNTPDTPQSQRPASAIFSSQGNQLLSSPPPTTVVAAASNHGATVSDLSVLGPTAANTAWYAMERASKSSLELQQDLRQYVRNTLFPSCKMFTSAEQMSYTESSHSVCQFVCEGMHVVPQFRAVWWEMNKKFIQQTLNRRRTDVTGQLKTKFLGT